MRRVSWQSALKSRSSSTTRVSERALIVGMATGRGRVCVCVDVMQVAHHYFENGIAHFTRRINTGISLGCANGEVAPFVGHNAFLRWSALQDAASVDVDGANAMDESGERKVWSEENVSEDFDMALRLQVRPLALCWLGGVVGDGRTISSRVISSAGRHTPTVGSKRASPSRSTTS